MLVNTEKLIIINYITAFTNKLFIKTRFELSGKIIPQIFTNIFATSYL